MCPEEVEEDDDSTKADPDYVVEIDSCPESNDEEGCLETPIVDADVDMSEDGDSTCEAHADPHDATCEDEEWHPLRSDKNR